MSQVQADIQETIKHKDMFDKLKGKMVLVTGATGLIGSMTVRTLCAANKAYGLGMRIVGQIRNREKADRIFGKTLREIALTERPDGPFDFMIHTVSPTASRFFISQPVETVKVSVGSTVDALEAAKDNGASVVYLSSMEEYGVPYAPGQVMTEDKVGILDHLNVRSSYPESKRLCECLCASYFSEYGVDVKIARLAQTFGAGVFPTDDRMPVQFARAAAQGKDIILHTPGRSVTNFVYLSDAIRGILTVLNRGTPGEAYNVCNDKETRTVREIAELVASDVAGGRIGVRVEIPETSMGYAPDVRMYLNSDKLRGLGWSAEVDMAEAYRRLRDYLLET